MTFFPSLPEDASTGDVQDPYPELYEPWQAFSEALMRGPSPLSVAERELIAAYVSGLNACSYCVGGHRPAAEAFGIAPDVFDKLMADVDTAPVDERLKPIFRFVKKLTETPARMVQGDADAVFAAGWDERALHHAIAVCARFNFMNRLIEGHGIKDSQAIREKRQALGTVGYGQGALQTHADWLARKDAGLARKDGAGKR